MNTEVKKLASEPLVWIGAVLLCVPLLASSSLNHLRDALTYESDSSSAISSFDPNEAREVEFDPSVAESVSRVPLAPAEVDDADLDLDSEMSMSEPETTSTEDEFALPETDFEPIETSSVSLLPPIPEVALADPGSLMGMGDIYQDDEDDEEDAQSESEGKTNSTVPKVAQDAGEGEDDFDFLFGDETAKENSREQSSAQNSAEPKPSDWQGADSGSQASSTPERFEPPADEKAESIWQYESTSSPPVFGQSMEETREESPSIEPAPVQMQPPEMISTEMQSPASEYYVELDSGPDWWTPYCQQSFWNTVPTRQTGLDAIVFAAMQNSPYVKLLNTEPQIAQTTILEADSLYDWSAFVESSWNDTDRPVVSLLDTGTAGGRFVQQQLLFEAGVQKSLRTGGHLRVGHAFQRTDNNSTFLSPADQATAQILLDYRQPLLRGAGRQVNCSQVMLAEINFESTQNNSQALLQQFLVDVVSEYWELHFARGVLMQKLRSVERAEQLLTELASFPDSRSRNRDLARIQAVSVARRTELIRAKNEVAMRQEKLLNLTYGTSMPDSATLEVIPIEAPGMFMVPHDLAHVTEMAVQNRAEVKVALGAIRASAVRQNLVLNDLKPRLDAIVSTFLSGVDSYKDVGGAFGDSLSYNPSYAVGVSFEMPIGRRNANARISRQQLEYQRLQYQLEQTLGNVRLDARLALRNVSSIASELENQKLAVAQANRELQYATGQAAAGVSKSADNTSFLIDDLMRSQEGLAVAESRLLRSQTDLSVALVELKRATGQLLQTAPMPQISDFTVQQATYEQPVSATIPWPAQEDSAQGTGQQNAETLWAAPE